MKKITALLLALILAIAVSACGIIFAPVLYISIVNGLDVVRGFFSASDDLFVAERIPFPELPTWDGNYDIAFFNETAYFISGSNRLQNQYFFSMNIDGTSYSVILPDYEVTHPTIDIDRVFIERSAIGCDGSLWVIERVLGYDQLYNQHEMYYLRKLDSTGVELLSFDISDTIAEFVVADYQFWSRNRLSSLNIDKEDNIYIGTPTGIIILDEASRLLFHLDTYAGRLIKMHDGYIYFAGSTYIQKIDTKNHELGESIYLPKTALSVLQGNNERFILFHTSLLFYVIEAETGKIVYNYSFPENDIRGVINATILEDGCIIIAVLSNSHIIELVLLRALS